MMLCLMALTDGLSASCGSACPELAVKDANLPTGRGIACIWRCNIELKQSKRHETCDFHMREVQQAAQFAQVIYIADLDEKLCLAAAALLQQSREHAV